MSSAFNELSRETLNAAVAALLCPHLSNILKDRAPGHCMRVSDLGEEMMLSVCDELRKQHPDDNIYILGGHDEKSEPHHITSTKLVEFRNPLPDGTLRPPLLVFIPPLLRTSAEDSFGVATFEELSFSNIYADLVQSLLKRIPASLVGYVRDIFHVIAQEDWLFADDLAKARYLLTALENGVDGETLGASIYELALVPDLKLFEEPSLVTGKIHRNVECIRNLMESHKSTRGRVADLNFSDKKLENLLCSYFEKYDAQDPEAWTRPIALKKEWWSISFDKWKFHGEMALDKISISALGTDLPMVQEDESEEKLLGLIGQQVLVPNNRRKMNVSFEVKPHPKKVKGLDHFTVQIISQTHGPVGKSKKVKSWTPKRMHCTVSLTKLNKIDFEEGWHYIRVLPWTAEGDPVPMANGVSSESSSDRSNESEPFYVLPGGILEEDPPQRAIPIEKSLEHARFKLQLIALGDDRNPDEINLSSIIWAERGTVRKSAQHDTLVAKFGREGAFQIHVPRILKVIEQRILSEPKHPSGWRMQINTDGAEPPIALGLALPLSTAMQSFLASRADLFSAIRQDTAELIMQAFAFADMEAHCISYAESYLDLVRSLVHQAETSIGAEQQSYLQSLRNVLAVDTIHVILTDFRGRHREAALVSPTHPLRALWFSVWAQIGKQWIDKIKGNGKDYLATIRKALLESLQPFALPVGTPVMDGRIFTPVDNLTPFWGLYAPTTEENVRGLMAEICGALGIAEPATVGSDISGAILSDKIERYIAQHPYLRELSINIFNPGSGSVAAEALVALQQRREYADLRYDIRLFSSDPESPALGEALESLGKLGSFANEAADAFAVSSGNHLFSKMRLAKHSISEFHRNTLQFAAHISLLLDVFPAEELSVADKPPGFVPLYGLIQDYETDFIDDDNGTFWHKYPVVGTVIHTDKRGNFHNLLARLSKAICAATSAVAASGASFKAVPMVTLGLDVPQRELIHEVHQISDWVFTIDRHMGIEFFDHGGKKNRPDYLIDFVPSASSQATHNLIISSRSTEELEAMLKPVLQRHGLPVDSKLSIQILDFLRSLSGQLALKLISSPAQQSEALGLALARLYLEYQGALKNQIIIPLDAHTDLYRTSSNDHGIDEEISLQRTDLGLLDLDFNQRIITCNLIEVKCFSQVGDFSAFNQLKERISNQINQSERILQRHFDPALKKPDRPDRLLKSRELAKILNFYLERSIRYELFETAAAKEAKAFLHSIEHGYSLQFRRCAIIFDFEKTGTGIPETEVGIEFHRIGKNLIHALLEGCKTIRDTSEDEAAVTVQKSLSEESIPEVPKLQAAAFIPAERDRTTTIIAHDDEMVEYKDATEDSLEARFSEAAETITPLYDQPEETERSDESEQKPPVEIDRDEKESEVETPQQRDGELPTSLDKEDRSKPLRNGEEASVPYDVILGVGSTSPQYGILGEVSGRKIALDLNHTHTISLFGVQGGGKSYTLGTIIEMASMPIDNINVLPGPLATVIFHYSPTQDYSPEFTSMIDPNNIDEELAILKEHYGAIPQPLSDVLILSPSDKLDQRKAEFPNIDIQPIGFSSAELKAAHWKFLMGAIGSQSMYMRQINLIMRGLRSELTLERLGSSIEKSTLSDHLKELALTRLQFAATYINDRQRLQDLIRPGRLIIVDLRDEYIEKDEALGLFVVMLQIFSEATLNGQAFNKLVVFDEAHKYIKNEDLISGLVEVVREMRHKGTSILVASQDPPSVPISLVELSSQIIMHKFNSPAWLRHIQKANAALSELTPAKMSQLGTGEAYIWSSRACDESFTRGAVKVKCRPRVTKHGGITKTAIKT